MHDAVNICIMVSLVHLVPCMFFLIQTLIDQAYYVVEIKNALEIEVSFKIEKGQAGLVLKVDDFSQEPLDEITIATQLPSWPFICINENLDSKTRRYFVDQVEESRNPKLAKKAELNIDLNLKIVSILGKITNIKMFGKDTDPSSIECRTKGEYSEWGSNWRNIGEETYRPKVSSNIVCGDGVNRLVMPVGGKEATSIHSNAMALCQNFGFGKIPTASNKNELNAIFAAMNVETTRWIWIDLNETNPWEFNGKNLNIKKSDCTVCSSNDCKVLDCNAEAKVVCKFDGYHNFTVRGLCSASKFDKHYYLYFDEILYLVGHSGSLIFQSDEEADRSWHIRSKSSSSAADTYFGVDNVLGDVIWKINRDDKCPRQGHQGTSLSLSLCDGIQFNCGDGSCIHISLRCDARADCPDGSDEVGCMLIDDQMVNYNTEIISSNSDVRKSKLSLLVDLDLKSFLDIDENDGFFRVNFFMKLSWSDRRLNFFNLKENPSANTLTSEESKMIWKPQVLFLNSEIWRHEYNMGPKEYIDMQESSQDTFAGNQYLKNALVFHGQNNNLNQIMDIRY